MPTTLNHLQLTGFLPLVQMGQGKEITIGPLNFWSSEDYAQHIPTQGQNEFKDRLNKISSHPITCISTDGTVDDNLLIDGIYLLYFATSFRSIYFDQDVPRFSPFTKWILLNQQKSYEKIQSQKTCINWVDEEICTGLGKALMDMHQYGGFVRAIRYFVDSFFERFETIHGRARHPGEFNEPEDILFLASSFESLFDLGESLPSSNFKQKLRPMLHLKYSRPVEIFWNWVDGFYRLKHDTIHGKAQIEPIFVDNPNLQISYTYLGIKLFIYAVYYKLYIYQLIPYETKDPFEAPEFKWIHSDEVMLFFWPEEALLKKILISMAQKEVLGESLADVQSLAAIYTSLIKRYSQDSVGKFIPTNKEALEQYSQAILNYSDLKPEMLPREFVEILQKR